MNNDVIVRDGEATGKSKEIQEGDYVSLDIKKDGVGWI